MSQPPQPARVLAPVDLSEASHASLAAARGVVDRFGAELTALYVDTRAHWVQDSIATFGIFVDGDEALKRRRTENESKLKAFVTSALGVDAANSIELRVIEADSAADAICDLAREESFDWICMSAVGRRGWRRAFVGSTASAVLRGTSVPVLTLRQPPDGEADVLFHDMRHVLATLDLSSHAAALADVADVIAGSGGQVTLAHVVEAVTDYGLYGTPMTAPQESIKIAEEWSTRELERLGTRVRKAGKQAPLVATGRPAQEILQFEEKAKPDLILMGTHGRTGLDRLTMGSVAESVVRHARGPVLVVPTALLEDSEPEFRR